MDRIPAIRRAIVANPPLWQRFAWVTLMVAVLTLGRWSIDRGQTGMAFAPYFPFILIAALLFGWRTGALATLLSGVAANRLLRDEPILAFVGWEDAVMVAFFFGTCALLVFIGDMVRRLVRQLEEAKAREELLNKELLHRAKNLLAVVGAIASLTARRSAPEGFFAAFADRIEALDRATDLLAGDNEDRRNVGQLIEHAIAPFRTDSNFRLDGPGCEIPERSCVPLMLVLHELCTNAAKHGALTVPEGVVEIGWSVEGKDPARLSLHWRERGGPPVASSGKQGMGSALLRAQKGLANVAWRLPKDGAECDIDIVEVRAL